MCEHSESSEKPLKVRAFDEARFGLINWHRRRYCPKGFRPPYIVHRRYEWTYLYAAVDPTMGESCCAYLPRVDGACLETSWGENRRAAWRRRALDQATTFTLFSTIRGGPGP